MNAVISTTSLALSFPNGTALFHQTAETPTGIYTATLKKLELEALRLSKVPYDWVFRCGAGVLELTETLKKGDLQPDLGSSPLANIAEDAQFLIGRRSHNLREVKMEWVPSDTNRLYFAGSILTVVSHLREEEFDNALTTAISQAYARHYSDLLEGGVSLQISAPRKREASSGNGLPPRPGFPPVDGSAKLAL